MFDWTKLQVAFRQVLGRDALSVDPSGNQAMLLEENTPVAIFRPRQLDGVDIHLRASITPNYAAMIATIAVYSHQVNFDEYFEFDENGKFIFGDEAVKFFEAHADELWRPAIGKKQDGARKPFNMKLN